MNSELEILTLEQVEKEIQDNPNLNIYELMALLYGSESQQFINNMLSSLQKLMDQKEVLLFDVTANNFKIQMLDEQIENKKEMIIGFIESAKERLEQRITDYRAMISQFETQLFVDSTYKEIEFAKLNRIYAINESFYYQLIRTKAEYMISQAGFVSNNIILEKSGVPKTQKKPILAQLMIMFVIIAMFLSIAIVMLRYLLYNKISSVDDISTYSDIAVLGGVPKSNIKSEVSQLIVHNRPKSMLAEAFRNIRSNLEFVNSEEKSKVITISSTISGEGKTFIAINLGAIIAMAGHKVILLDFDLRKPRFHKSFEVENLKGISTILIGRHNIEECLQNTDVENLQFITSGPIPPNPGEIIVSDKYKKFIDELRQTYEFIIIDTPPIGIVTDAMISYQMADYPLYVTRAGVSPKAFIEHINDFAETSKLNNLSIVLNGVEGGVNSYGYGYKYGYGYRYGYSKYGYGYGYGYTEYMKNNNYYSSEPKEKQSFSQQLLSLFKRNKD
jgi:capsular exopolysaccharide synthesis family protein